MKKKIGGDGKMDFTLTANQAIGIEVKSRHGSIDRVRWSVSSEEVEKNAVIICILIQEEVNEAQSEYHVLFAGFLPTQMIKLKTGRISFGIEQLLYGGGLYAYLELQSAKSYNFQHHSKSPHISLQEDLNKLSFLADEAFQKRNYQTAINYYNQALQVNINDTELYYKRGLARYYLLDNEGAIADYNQAIKINPKSAKVYNQLGLARYELGDYEGAIEDYTQAIRINPYNADAYKNRADTRFHIGDNLLAIEDYTQAIKINPDLETDNTIEISYDDDKNPVNTRFDLEDDEKATEEVTRAIKINPHDADAYYNRGNIHLNLGEKLLASEDFQKSSDLYWFQGKLTEHKNARERILELEIEASLDILNF